MPALVYRRLRGVAVLLLLGGLGVGCQQSPTSPEDASESYTQLVQVAVAQTEGRPDTTLFWLRNTRVARARTLMLDLGIDQLRYDRPSDALCVWSGEGLWPASGFATAPTSGAFPPDSVGRLCNIEGTCTSTPVTDRWMRFECR